MSLVEKIMGKNSEKGKGAEDDSFAGKNSPFIASARTGLAGKDDAILKRMPGEYQNKTVNDVLDYIISQSTTDSEIPLAQSLKNELEANGSIVVVNGKTASLKDSVSEYIIDKEHILPNGSTKKYKEIEIEISSVQQGGYF